MVAYLKIAVLCAIVGLSAAEVVSHKPCPGIEDVCTVHEVRVVPCPEANTGQICKIKRGRSAGIEFDYTPKFDSPTLEARAYWATDVDLPLVNMDTDACKYTKCPVVKDEKVPFAQSMPVARKFPVGTYEIKWRMTGQDNKECCTMFSIKLVK